MLHDCSVPALFAGAPVAPDMHSSLPQVALAETTAANHPFEPFEDSSRPLSAGSAQMLNITSETIPAGESSIHWCWSVQQVETSIVMTFSMHAGHAAIYGPSDEAPEEYGMEVLGAVNDGEEYDSNRSGWNQYLDPGNGCSHHPAQVHKHWRILNHMFVIDTQHVASAMRCNACYA